MLTPTRRRPQLDPTNRHKTSGAMLGHLLILLVAFELLPPIGQLAHGLQQQAGGGPAAEAHEAMAAAAVAAAAQAQPMMSLGGAQPESGSPLDAAGALASEDLIAAESSQAPDAPAEHKAFTSGGQLMRQDTQQLPASVAPGFNQQAAQQQQQPNGIYPAHLMARLQASHKANFNPYMAAAMAQQQMAAAAAGMHSQVPHAPVHHHQQQQQQQQQHHQQAPPAGPHPHLRAPQQQQQQQHPAVIHHQVGAAHHPQQQPGIQQHHAHQQQHHHHHHQQQQQQHQNQHQHQPMAVQESAVRHNVVAAPPQAQAQSAGAPIESNFIELNEVAPSQHQQQPQPQPAQAQAGQQQQLAAASSVQHPVVATGTGTTSVAPMGGQQEAWPLQAPDIPKIVNLEVKCEKNLMKVSVEFDRVFNGVIFSKGHFSQGQCIHVPQNSAKQQAYFDISINSCGTQGNTQNGLYGMGGNTGSGTFFENTVVIQYDPNVQEVYDHARKLRCTWHDQYEKAVTFRPFPVDMLDIVRADFAGDNVGCWMQIQVGKGPWASEVAGIVKIGQTMTMVLAIKDEENKFDMLVRNCFAHDGKRGPIELVDKSGCITRPKLMSRFTKIKNFGSSATVLSYAHFQAFKFPDSMEVHFQCTIQICRHQCPDQCSSSGSPALAGGAAGAIGGESYSESTISGTFNINSQGAGSQALAAGQQGGDSMQLRKYGPASGSSLSRARRDTSALSHHHRRWLNGSHTGGNTIKPQTQNVGLNRVIQVVSTGDLAFAIQQQKPHEDTGDADTPDAPQAGQLTRIDLATSNQICMSSYNFVLALMMLVLVLLCSCLMAISLYVRQRSLLRATGNGKLAQFQPSPPRPTSSSTLASNSSASSPIMPHNRMSHNLNHHHHHQVPTSRQQQQQQLFDHDQQVFHGCQ